MEYNEFYDYGTGWEEQAERAYEQMIDAQIALLSQPACECEIAGTQPALTALLTGRCSLCGWDA